MDEQAKVLDTPQKEPAQKPAASVPERSGHGHGAAGDVSAFPRDLLLSPKELNVRKTNTRERRRLYSLKRPGLLNSFSVDVPYSDAVDVGNGGRVVPVVRVVPHVAGDSQAFNGAVDAHAGDGDIMDIPEGFQAFNAFQIFLDGA